MPVLMTNEELFTELKQYIATTVSRHMAHVATKDDISHLGARINVLDQKFAGLDQRITVLEQRITVLEQRITVLEEKVALLDEKIDLVQAAIAETFLNSTHIAAARIDDHEHRLQRLEGNAA